MGLVRCYPEVYVVPTVLSGHGAHPWEAFDILCELAASIAILAPALKILCLSFHLTPTCVSSSKFGTFLIIYTRRRRPATLRIRRLLPTARRCDLMGFGRGGGAGLDTEFLKDMLKVLLHRAGARAEDYSDFNVGFALGHPE